MLFRLRPNRQCERKVSPFSGAIISDGIALSARLQLSHFWNQVIAPDVLDQYPPDQNKVFIALVEICAPINAGL